MITYSKISQDEANHKDDSLGGQDSFYTPANKLDYLTKKKFSLFFFEPYNLY